MKLSLDPFIEKDFFNVKKEEELEESSNNDFTVKTEEGSDQSYTDDALHVKTEDESEEYPSSMTHLDDIQTAWHLEFIGICVQDLEKLLHAATFGTSKFQALTCDTCAKHRPHAGCEDCRRLRGNKWTKVCVNHAKEDDSECADCRLTRWYSQEKCRNLITKTFAALLHHCLREVYSMEMLPHIQFPYPDIVNKFTLQQLINHKESCEDFLETLWCVNGHRDGSVFFYHYGCNHRPNNTTAGFIQGLSWQLILPYGIVRALIMSPRTCIRRKGL